MDHVLFFDKTTGIGCDVDYLDDGRIIVDKISSEDFYGKNQSENKSNYKYK